MFAPEPKIKKIHVQLHKQTSKIPYIWPDPPPPLCQSDKSKSMKAQTLMNR